MPEHPRRRAVAFAHPQLQIHACVVLWGFTAILGKLITLPAIPLVWWRMVIVAALLALVPRVRRVVRALPARRLAAYAAVGVVLGLHWVTFYASIKLANASVGATCIALAPVFLAGIEPLVARRGFDPRELVIGVGAVPGVALVAGGVPAGMHAGLAVGALSAALVALFSAMNKRLLNHDEAAGTRTDALAITALELGAGALVLTGLAPLAVAVWPSAGPAFVWPDLHDAALLAVLAVACTIVPFALSIVALRQLTAFNAQLAVVAYPLLQKRR